MKILKHVARTALVTAAYVIAVYALGCLYVGVMAWPLP